MGILGQGKGFLGLSRKYNGAVAFVDTLLAIIGIAYFASLGQSLSAMGVLGLWIVILLETFREK